LDKKTTSVQRICVKSATKIGKNEKMLQEKTVEKSAIRLRLE
jgi:hypothetical protein